jgi:hypothetical protein
MTRDRSKVVFPAALGALGMVATWALVSDDGTRTIPAFDEVAAEVAPAPTPAAVAIDIEDDAVRVHGTSLSSPRRFALASGRIAASDREGHLVKPLFGALEAADLADPIAITASDATPWPTLVDLLYTAGRAGARRYAFVTDEGTIAIEPPTFDPSGRFDGPKVVLELIWNGDAIVGARRLPSPVAVVEPRGTTCRLLDRTLSSASRASLRSLRSALCRAAPSGVRFVLSPSPDANYGEAVEVASALRSGAECPVVFTVTSGGDVAAGPPAMCTRDELAALAVTP